VTADRQEPSDAIATKTTRLKEKIAKLGEEMQRLQALEARMLATPDQQISLTDPDARSMATSGRGSGVVGYNVQAAVDTEHHLIVAHEVINVGNDRGQLADISQKAKAVLETGKPDVVADRGHLHSEDLSRGELPVQKLYDSAKLRGNSVGHEHHPDLPPVEVMLHSVPVGLRVGYVEALA
jgi:transposase